MRSSFGSAFRSYSSGLGARIHLKPFERTPASGAMPKPTSERSDSTYCGLAGGATSPRGGGGEDRWGSCVFPPPGRPRAASTVGTMSTELTGPPYVLPPGNFRG